MGTVLRIGLALAVLFTGAARGEAPAYTAAGIVNASDFSPGPFAPNSAVSLFGTNLSYNTQALTAAAIIGSMLPTQMAGVAVYVDGAPAPLLYVSPGQVNFLIPFNEIPGPAAVTVVRQGVNGPTVTIQLVDAAPQLFYTGNGYAIAEDWNSGNSLVTADAPASAGDIVILFATGLGAVAPTTLTGELAPYASAITGLANLKVSINGTALAASAILYAGLSPGSAGLYQINVVLPANSGPNPQIQVSMGVQRSAVCTLAVQ